jgi:hypothetical protein
MFHPACLLSYQLTAHIHRLPLDREIPPIAKPEGSEMMQTATVSVSINYLLRDGVSVVQCFSTFRKERGTSKVQVFEHHKS